MPSDVGAAQLAVHPSIHPSISWVSTACSRDKVVAGFSQLSSQVMKDVKGKVMAIFALPFSLCYKACIFKLCFIY